MDKMKRFLKTGELIEEIIDYRKLDYKINEHHKRYKKHVKSMERKLICQECGGYGGEYDIVEFDLGGPWEECGWCEGTGLVTPYLRGQWLKYKKEEKRNKNKQGVVAK